MTTTETRRYEMLLRVREFGARHRDRFPAGSPALDAFDHVAAVVAQLGEQAVSKMSAAGGGKTARAMARRALTERLDAISRCARVIAETTPGFDDSFRLPNPRTEQSILTTGRVFLREAEHSVSRFAELGMPSTLVASLKVLVDEFDQAIRTAHAGRQSHLAARSRHCAGRSGGSGRSAQAGRDYREPAARGSRDDRRVAA